MSDEFSQMDATGLAELVKRRQVSPLELIDAAIARHEAWDARLNAVVLPNLVRARKRAASLDPDAGSFAGVPFLMKDLNTHIRKIRVSGTKAQSNMWNI